MSVLQSAEYVSAGSRMVWTGQFPNFFMAASQTPNDAIQMVAAYLRNNYQLVVEKADNGITWQGFGSGSITLHLRTDIDRGDGEQDDGLTDILGNVNQAFENFNNPVLAAVINSYTSAATHDSVNTKAPLPTVPEQQRQEKDVTISSTPSWWDDLVTKVEAGSIGLVLGAGAVVAVIIYFSVKSAAR